MSLIPLLHCLQTCTFYSRRFTLIYCSGLPRDSVLHHSNGSYVIELERNEPNEGIMDIQMALESYGRSRTRNVRYCNHASLSIIYESQIFFKCIR